MGSFIVENIACFSNSTIEQALLIEKNKKLKEQLEKECLTPPTKGKTLDDVLSHKRVRVHKKGIGYNPRNDKNGATPPNKVNFVQEGHKVDGNAKKFVVNGGATRGNPNRKFAGKNNPSYVGYDSGGPKWVFDSGCTNHMTGGKEALDEFINAINSKSGITFGDNSKGKLLHLDLFGPSCYESLGGSKYGLVIVDDYSRYTWVFLLKSKDETHKYFIDFAKRAQRIYEVEIKTIRTDNGFEFKNYTMDEFF
ncbi:hypothetical protein QYE76_014714 [Lolium multiflorum]|uniref:Integrase catalytic domain-containing protein n=1 Tax=Lolium multiflorum TaxID=4521 RepID=A0AAD8U3H1_LOLMU|nr:hypothetical protein QYE76_014714 [Lolium multiflorum]